MNTENIGAGRNEPDDPGSDRVRAAVNRPPRNGFSLVTILFAMIVAGAIATVALATARDERLAGHAMRDAARAFYAADAGLKDVLSEWKTAKYDTLMPVPGDSVTLNWRVLENGAEYRTLIRRVDGGGTGLYSVRVLGRSGPNRPGRREVASYVTQATGIHRAIGVNQYMEVGGGTELHGSCADVHSNGQFKNMGNLTTAGWVYAADAIVGTPLDFEGNPAPTELGTDSLEIPDLDPTAECGGADYFLRDGWVVDVAAGDSTQADASVEAQTWQYAAGDNAYELKEADKIQPGIWCGDGDLKLAGGIGTPGLPLTISLITEGHIEADGNSLVSTAAHPDGYVFLAGGDVMFSGGSATPFTVPNITGVVYAHGHCELKGSTVLKGQLMCFEGSVPGWSKDLTTKNKLGGGTKIKYDCDGYAVGGSGNSGVTLLSRWWRQVYR